MDLIGGVACEDHHWARDGLELFFSEVTDRVWGGKGCGPTPHDRAKFAHVHGQQSLAIRRVVLNALREEFGFRYRSHPAPLRCINVLSIVAGGHQLPTSRSATDLPDKDALD